MQLFVFSRNKYFFVELKTIFLQNIRNMYVLFKERLCWFTGQTRDGATVNGPRVILRTINNPEMSSPGTLITKEMNQY